MDVRAFILIQTEIGKASEVAKKCHDLPSSVSVDLVTGPYDVILVVQCSSIEQLGSEVVAAVQQINGVTRTLTCPSAHLLNSAPLLKKETDIGS